MHGGLAASSGERAGEKGGNPRCGQLRGPACAQARVSIMLACFHTSWILQTNLWGSASRSTLVAGWLSEKLVRGAFFVTNDRYGITAVIIGLLQTPAQLLRDRSPPCVASSVHTDTSASHAAHTRRSHKAPKGWVHTHSQRII